MISLNKAMHCVESTYLAIGWIGVIGASVFGESPESTGVAVDVNLKSERLERKNYSSLEVQIPTRIPET